MRLPPIRAPSKIDLESIDKSSSYKYKSFARRAKIFSDTHVDAVHKNVGEIHITREFTIGEKVTILKEGTQHGKAAIVIDPLWTKERVKVRMVVDRSIKSYTSRELRKWGFARGKAQISKSWGMITAAVNPSLVLDDWERQEDVLAQTHYIEEFLHSEATTRKKDVKHTRSSVLETDKIVSSRAQTYLLLCLVALSGAVLAVIEVELLSANDNIETQLTNGMKYAVTATTACSMWLMFVYYKASLILGKMQKLYEPQETLFSTGLAHPMLLELAMLLVHCPPGVDGTFELHLEHADSSPHEYSWDAVLSVFVVSRVYLLYRGLHYWKG